MKIITIEPTPSPNTMKIILDQELKAGNRNNYKQENIAEAPLLLQKIFEINGVKGIFHVADFLALERNAKVDWQAILPQVRIIFGEDANRISEGSNIVDTFGDVRVSVQMFKDIPLQVKLQSTEEEQRFSLPDRFIQSMNEAQNKQDNYVLERKWKDYGTRYGELAILGEEIVEEIIAAYPPERLERIVKQSLSGNERIPERKLLHLSTEDLNHENWQTRYRLLEQMAEPTIDDYALLEKAISDEKAAIRRLAVVYAGMVKDTRVLPLLYKGLQDKSVSVRRTAGDAVSDLGFKEAMPEMCKALNDKNKLVRWRAAMFLYEEGDETVLPSLENAENDTEFEVKLQVKMAIERIKGGQVAKGSVWKQMTELRK